MRLLKNSLTLLTLAAVACSAYAKNKTGVLKETPIVYTQGAGLQPHKVVEFKQTQSQPLTLNIFYPDEYVDGQKRPAIVLFFGGGWKGGSPTQLYPQADYFASRGMIAISARYRTMSRYKAEPYQCVEDGKSAVRYIRQHADELGINPDMLAAGGASAGGHVAAATATIKDYDCPEDDLSISAVPNALVLYNPVYDNGPNGYGHERVGDYYKKISPIDNLDGTQPPTIVFMGENDKHTPPATVRLYEQRMRDNGNVCESILYPGQKHGFFNLHKSKDPEYFIKTMTAADQFLTKHSYLKGEPTVQVWFDEQAARGTTME